MLHVIQQAKDAVLPTMVAAVLVASQPLSAVYATTDTPQTATNNTITSQEATPEPAPTTTSPAPTQTSSSDSPAPVASPPPKTVKKPSTGPAKPTGADSGSYVKNEQTGHYENEKYSWDPATGKTTPKGTTDYSYNPTTKQWETTEWRYDAPSGAYVPNVVATSSAAPASLNPSEKQQIIADAQKNGSGATAKPHDDHTSSNGNNHNQGGHSQDKNDQGFFDNFFNAAVSNTVNSNATSGDASVSGNTTGGSATSGDAAAIANIVNMLQSSWGWAGDLTTFMADIYGNVVGDIVLDPAKAGSKENSSSAMDVEVNATSNASITNDVNLQAKSGNADVTKNTKAGNATSGDATAVANIINLINSSISAGDSFLGMLNIHGNLDGDVLLPPAMLKQIKALSMGQTSSNVAATSSANQSITNNTNQQAASGNALVDKNTEAGSATTGSASNDLSIINLTGRQIVGDNALLVFVNVFGKWVGMIVDAPAGSTSAALGSGVTTNSTAADKADLEVNETNNQSIVNNVNLNAQTGDATVAQNTEAGSATTGDAQTAVNIANISNSQLALTQWFGVLFINVFGSWNGSFGIDTSAGDKPKPAPVVTPLSASTGHNPAAGSANGHVSPDLQKFIIDNGNHDNYEAASALAYAADTADSVAVEPEVDSDASGKTRVSQDSSDEVDTEAGAAIVASSSGSGDGDFGWMLSAFGILLGLGLIGTERFLSIRDSRRRVQQAA